MERIKSFQIDHTKLQKGLYVSRIDGDTVTYDLRMCTPNQGVYLENAALHTLEHLFATYVRVINKTFSDQIISVGPISLLQQTFAYTAAYEGEIPGSAEAECGNYRDHDLAGAKKIASAYGKILEGWTPEKMCYPE